MTFLGGFHFLRPGWLIALGPVLALAFWFARRRRRDGLWDGVIDAELLSGLRLDAGSGGGISPWAVLALIWTLAVLALAGPSWQREKTGAFRAPDARVVVLDLSPSMNAKDLSPDRVSRARYAVDDVLRAAGDSQVALVAFGDDAYTVTPLTRDVATVKAMLAPLTPDILPASGDNLEPALDMAAQLLNRAGTPRGQVIVLTDGFADPAAAFAAAGRLRKQGATVQVVAIGTPAGAPQPSGEGDFVRDAAGRTRLARVDFDRLGRLAASGGGRLSSLDRLPSLLADLRSASVLGRQAERVEGIEVAHWRDGGVWLLPFLLLGAALMARRGWL